MPFEDQAKRAGQNVSLWEATTTTSVLNPLRQDTGADVCIIGAGIAGLSVAYTLARAGQGVVVLDDGLIGNGMTARTTAHLVNALDDRYYDIESFHGAEGARIAAESHGAAIDAYEEIVGYESINCDFERLDGYLIAPPGSDSRSLEEELAAVHRAGLTSVERVSRAPVESFDTGPALRFPRQAQIHPRRFLAGVTAAIQRYGGQI